ncbi:Lrp/AsnC family transcriptional regulator [Pigmentiphaga sp. H8]|uniref:Lrp/AsnC family transcriptional regulator n=1 Tax=unclassified Pigmentiphaga TaxID=2626614 RepID=UPI000F5AF408|nr:Lrp/AsnC family transcriptional regulator [Pigmentiphaga sp. H8]AZG10995.1 Lrp/AsnC family transcriptional regulator [Pigmentiphaga sp. H8]
MSATVDLDDVDRRILSVLQNDATLTNQELAARVHVSAPTCLRRVRRLIEQGVIEKQVAIVSPEKVGAGLTGIVEITLDVQAAERMAEFEAAMAQETAVTQCYRVSTGPDFVLVVQVPDMAAYHALAHRAFTAQGNVRNVRTFFSVHRSKFDTRVAI